MNKAGCYKLGKNIIVVFMALAGVTVGAASGYRAGNHLISFAENRILGGGISGVPRDFNISFENKEDLKLFSTSNAAAEISDQNATDGRLSLMVEYPAGVDKSALILQTDEKTPFDWRRIGGILFDMTNAIDTEVDMALEIRSGKGAYKRSFKKALSIIAQKTVTVNITSDELGKYLDMGEISEIIFAVQDPPTTFRIYFDNFRILTNNKIKG